MFPIQDSTPRKTFPYVNYIIIAVNLVVFLLEINARSFDAFVVRYAFVPANFSIFNLYTYGPVFTSLFIHGSVLHILSNMWFLRIFGDNIEDKFGHIRYLFFYLAAGLIATLAQYIFTTNSTIPSIGASGAISGVIGAYFIFYRHSTIETLVFFFLANIPSWFFIGYWFGLQVFSGISSLVTNSIDFGGTAWFAHIGGFSFGFVVAVIIRWVSNREAKMV